MIDLRKMRLNGERLKISIGKFTFAMAARTSSCMFCNPGGRVPQHCAKQAVKHLIQTFLVLVARVSQLNYNAERGIEESALNTFVHGVCLPRMVCISIQAVLGTWTGQHALRASSRPMA